MWRNDPANSLLGFKPKRNENICPTPKPICECLWQHIHSPKWKQPKGPLVDKGINKTAI